MSSKNKEEHQLEVRAQSEAFKNIWNNRPDLRGRIYAVNNNSENATKGAMNKAMGVLEGVSDLEFLISEGRTIHIEWKTATGSQKPAQKGFQIVCEKLGHIYVIVRSEEEFLAIIHKYEKA